MLNQARKLQIQQGLNNINWILDNVLPLKFPDNHFSVVVTRFSFHHLIDYEKVFEEMIRVCKPEGRVIVADICVPEDKAKAYDQMEKLRDPSHANVLSTEQFASLFEHALLTNCRRTSYNLEIELENQLNASYPNQEDRQKLRELIIKDVNVDSLGIDVKQINNTYKLYYPIQVYCAEKTNN